MPPFAKGACNAYVYAVLQRHVLCSWPVEHASTLHRTLNGGSGYPRKACVAASPGSRVAYYRPFLAVIQTHQADAITGALFPVHAAY